MPHIKIKYLGKTVKRIEEQSEERQYINFLFTLRSWETEKSRGKKHFAEWAKFFLDHLRFLRISFLIALERSS